MYIWTRVLSAAASKVERLTTGVVRSVALDDVDRVDRYELRRQLKQTKAELATALRHKAEFFELIERIEKQRDEWREMFERSAMEQLTALNMVDRALATERRKLSFVVKRLNEYLEKDGKKPIDEGKLSTDSTPPAGEYKRYAESMKMLFVSGIHEVCGRNPQETRPVDIDALAEREKLGR
jgi:hypothetical protein